MTIFERLEKYLKNNLGKPLPKIRYFDGTDSYSDITGQFQSKSLEVSLDNFLKENNE